MKATLLSAGFLCQIGECPGQMYPSANTIMQAACSWTQLQVLCQYTALPTHSRGLNESYTVHLTVNADSQCCTRRLSKIALEPSLH